MSTEQIYTLAASCLLIAAGIAAFPYRLNDANTSWLPRKLRPDWKYLERPYEYDYPARNVNLLFSVSVAVTGMLALIVMLTPELAENAPPEIWFSALPVLYPAYASCQVFFWRKDYGDGFCYADRLVEISFDWAPTAEQMAQVGGALGQGRVCPSPCGPGLPVVY